MIRPLIKISSWICGSCVIVAIIFFGILIAMKGLPPAYAWGLILLYVAGVAIGSFALSYLGGLIVSGNKGALRLGVLIFVLWVMGFYFWWGDICLYMRWGSGACDEAGRLIGITPAILYFGTLWIIAGFLSKKIK
jgi:hypothetical protein